MARPAQDFPITLDNFSDVEGAPAATLTVNVWGADDYDQSPDHHLVAAFNGNPVADEKFDGLVDHTFSVVLPAGVAQDGANTLNLSLPFADLPAGVEYDMVELDRYSVTYPRAFTAREDGGLAFTAAGSVFQVNGLPAADSVVAYRLDNGTPVFLSSVQASGGSATFAGSGAEASYVVSANGSVLKPAIQPAAALADITTGPAEYLVISHPDFIAGLAPLIQARQAQMSSVKVVSVEDVYAQFGYGIFDPAGHP